MTILGAEMKPVRACVFDAKGKTFRKIFETTPGRVVLGLLIPALLINGYTWLKEYNNGIRRATEELLQQNALILSNGMQEPLWNINHESGEALLDTVGS